MSKPFMIRFPFKGQRCYANVYRHEAGVREYHVQIIDPQFHSGLPPRIVLQYADGRFRLSDPPDLSGVVLEMIIAEIEKRL
ncbi:MAG TPA: hypothetical protein VD996_00705 [Chitinophagaceae bacterium]|nr:hypothetical protein [Chitinophagaceae bacterium]